MSKIFIPSRFLWKIDMTGECWLWLAAKGRDGYGRFIYDKKSQLAHRLAYQFWVGTIPDSLVLDHLCRVRHCVNPEHLEAVTQKVNNNRGDRSSSQNKTHCYKGHKLTPETMYKRKNSYDCIMCRRERDKRRRSLKKLSAV